ncbi:sensor histidine kinase [Caulobacter sp. 17J80-11]|uniref:sensor histidine kinase n=1 Tax=Caulobacter sp. 17J80-11 TaxID=2763502 RepID=UPI001653B27D|nr:sensor histidine kinase [Caulobacter sp. 17J80-11]MBC6983047.1 sensor histidine kinase [Caulobacter sp. 17J80-11]
MTARLRAVADPESRRHLAWLADVIAALGLLNRRLDDDEPADFAAYLVEAVGFWKRVCAGRRITFNLEVAEAPVPPAVAATLALIVHELIGGAVAHSSESRAGQVKVAARRSGGLIELLVQDDGAPLDQRHCQETVTMVRGLAEHLGGSFEVTQAAAGVEALVRAPVLLLTTPPIRH